jgi:ubiquinone/menaquinone biosynthesis C-methylase UbiE
MRTPEPSEIMAWYNRRYSTGQEQAFGRPFEESVMRLDLLPSVLGLKVLDVACGQGYFLKAVQQAGGAPYGVDISFEAVRIARRQTNLATIFTADGQRLPFPDNTFDVVTCWGSLEHHPDMKQALSEFIRIAKPGSPVVLRVPNRCFWAYQVRRWFTGERAGTEQQEIVEYLLSLDEWRSLFEQAGLMVEQVGPDNWFLHHALSSVQGMKQKLKILARRFSLLVAPLQYTYSVDFVCKSPETGGPID